MSDRQAAMSTDHEPAISSDHADHQAAGLSIAEAARRLGVSENAIRQRIKRETIRAAKVAGVWQVFPADHETDHQATVSPTPTPTTSDHEPIEAAYRITPAEIEQAIERTGDKYVTDMQAMLAPLVDRIGELEREAGRLEAERDEARRVAEAAISERDELQTAHKGLVDAFSGLVSALQEQQDRETAQTSSALETATDAATGRPRKRRQPKWWLRLFGVDE